MRHSRKFPQIPEKCCSYSWRATFRIGTSKYRLWWKAFLCDISSGSSLFAKVPFYRYPEWKGLMDIHLMYTSARYCLRILLPFGCPCFTMYFCVLMPVHIASIVFNWLLCICVCNLGIYVFLFYLIGKIELFKLGKPRLACSWLAPSDWGLHSLALHLSINQMDLIIFRIKRSGFKLT